MEKSKVFYGGVKLGDEEIRESNIKNKTELEYYTIKNSGMLKEEASSYGIEVVKREYSGNHVTVETNFMENVADDLSRANEIADLLKRNTVTPYGLDDTMEELLK